MIDYQELFIKLYKEVADCEAPEGTQVDDVLAAYQSAYEEAVEADPAHIPWDEFASDHPDYTEEDRE